MERLGLPFFVKRPYSRWPNDIKSFRKMYILGTPQTPAGKLRPLHPCFLAMLFKQHLYRALLTVDPQPIAGV